MKISVIIPVRNGGGTLEKCLGSIRSQTLENIEIIILDSMSTDNSREIAFAYDSKIITIPEGTFNHGLTRNIGAEKASGDFLFYTVQDAWLSQNDLLERMVKHFGNEKMMGVTGHQAVPNETDKNPVVWYRPYSKPEVIEKFISNTNTFESLTSLEQKSLIAWDDVVAMYRKSALITQPFIKTEFAEDWEWSYLALRRGWKLIYDPSLVVYHYHHQSFRYAFNLTYTLNYHLHKFFKFTPSVPPVIIPGIKAVYGLLKNKEVRFKDKLYWSIHNISFRLANYFSTIDFLVRLNWKGESGIEKGYNKYCKVVPQGKQKSRQLKKIVKITAI